MTDFHAALASEGELPVEVAGSTSAVALRQLKRPAAGSQQRIPLAGIALLEEYWYEYRPRQQEAWSVLRFQRDAIPGCTGACAVHLGFGQVDGQVQEFCGRWNASALWGQFPLALLPESCRSRCVSCELASLRRQRRAETHARAPAGQGGKSR